MSYHRCPGSAGATQTLGQFTQNGFLRPLLHVPTPPRPTPAPARSRRPRAWLAVALLLSGLAVSGAAFCATCDGDGPLTRERVLARLDDQGYRTVWTLHRQGGAFQAEGIDESGNPVSLWVDAHTGDLLQRQPLRLL